MRTSVVVLLSTTLFVATPPLAAQTATGAISGVVQDPQGAVVPNAKVRLQNEQSGSGLETVTNSDGYYTFASVSIGNFTYALAVEAAGFGGYLLVHGFWSLVAAAVLVQIGNSIFWVAYAPLIFAIAAEGEREHWFALVTTLRTAGLAAGGLIAGATVAVGGRAGFTGVAAE